MQLCCFAVQPRQRFTAQLRSSTASLKLAHHAVIAPLGVDIILAIVKLSFAYLQMETFFSDACRASWLVLMRTTSGLRCAMMMGKRSGSVYARSASGLLPSCPHNQGLQCMYVCLPCNHAYIQSQFAATTITCKTVFSCCYACLEHCIQSSTYTCLSAVSALCITDDACQLVGSQICDADCSRVRLAPLPTSFAVFLSCVMVGAGGSPPVAAPPSTSTAA